MYLIEYKLKKREKDINIYKKPYIISCYVFFSLPGVFTGRFPTRFASLYIVLYIIIKIYNVI